MAPIRFSINPRGVVALVTAWLIGLALLYPSDVMAENPRYASIVIDAVSGETLHAENAVERRYPASLTKMMTLYLLFEALENDTLTLDDTLPISPHAAAQPPSKLGVRPGDRLTVEKAILSLIVRSANDVAVVVAEGLAGSERAFAGQMTDKARALGMYDTVFRNASGLPDNAQVTTARDMSTLALRLMRDFPQHYGYFSRTRFTYEGRTHTGHNRLLDNYAGADGLKTGYIRASGFNVATSAVRDGRRIVSVVMGGFTAQSRDAHMAELLDRGFVRASLLTRGDWTARADVFSDTPAARTLPGVQKADAALAVASSRQAQSPSSDAAVVPAASNADASADDPIRELIARVENTESLPGEAWAVQIGAFSNREGAQSRVTQAVDYLGAQLGEARAVVVPAVGGEAVFRARLVDLQENQARRSCQQLMQRGMDCVVIPAGVGG